MTVQTTTCAWVECDSPDCGNDKGWPDEGPFHFSTDRAALDYVLGEKGMGWTRLPDGRLLCRSCSEAADCAATGHQWTDWRVHHRDPGIEWRLCEHCGGGFEERLTVAGDAL